MKPAYILFLILVVTNGLAQSKNDQKDSIDSLKNVIENAQHDSIVIKSLRQWDNLIYFENPNLDLELNLRMIKLCKTNLKKKLTEQETLFFQNNLASAQNIAGELYRGKSNQVLAMQYFSESKENSKEHGNRTGVANALVNIGLTYQDQGKYAEAVNYLTQGLKIYEEENNESGAATAYGNIGIIYSEQEDYDKAIEYYEKGLVLFLKNNDQHKAALATGNLAIIHKNNGNYPKALEYHTKALKILDEFGDQLSIALELAAIGNLYSDQKEYDQALTYYFKSLDIREENGFSQGVASTLNNIGRVYADQANYSKAIDFCEKSIKLSKKEDNLVDIRNAAFNLAEVYKTIGNDQAALEMFELQITMSDSINSEVNQKAVIRQEYKYQYEKQAAVDSIQTLATLLEQDKKLAQEKAEKEKAESRSKRNEIIIYFGIAIVAVIMFFVYMVVKSLRLVREQKEKVDEAYDQLEEKNTEILDSINYAKRIQSAILPPDKLVKEYLQDSFILYKPKDIVAGDFYWMEPFAVATDSEGTSENGVLFAAADCTGHGVPGAMVSVVCNNGLNRSVREYGLSDPGDILGKTREIVISEFEKSEEEVKDGMDIALCALSGRTLRYAGAHNPLWIIRSGEEVVEEIKAHKQPIGKYGEPTPYPTHTIELNEGDSFYIFSDGYADQFGGSKGKKMKTVNFKKLLISIQNESINKQRELIDEAFEKWKANFEQLDDVCVIGVRV